MPLYRRIARRGFSNYPFKKHAEPVNLQQLQNVYKSGEVVSLESLREKGVVGRRIDLVKILADGEIKKKLTVKGLKVSANAARKIMDAGGTVEGFETAPDEKAAAEAPEPDAPEKETASDKKSEEQDS
jgi:large subunit ribosomal protein L15